MRRVKVAVEPSYEVMVGDGALSDAAAVADPFRRVVIVSHQRLLDLHADAIPIELARSADGDDGLWVVLIDEGEAAKSMSTVEYLCRAFAAGGLLRDDLVVAFGGGVVGDVAGSELAVRKDGPPCTPRYPPPCVFGGECGFCCGSIR